MNRNHALSHPEIELRPSLFTTSRASKLQTPTILDLLEVYPDHVNWKEKLDHLALLNHFRVRGSYVILNSWLSFLKGENVLNVGETPQPLRILSVQSGKSYRKAIL